MSVDSMLDVAVSGLEGGGLELVQFGGGLDEPNTIRLHRVQIAWIAERAGVLPAPDPDLLDRLNVRHIGRLHAMYERLEEIRRFYLDEILDHCGSGIEFALHLRAVEDLVDEMLEDIGTAPPAAPCNAVTLPVTLAAPKTPKRAMTGAERVAKHRARQTELQLPTTTEKEQPCPT